MPDVPDLTDEGDKAFNRAYNHAKKLGHQWLKTNHHLLALAEERGNSIDSLFSRHGITAERIRRELLRIWPQEDHKVVLFGADCSWLTCGLLQEVKRCRVQLAEPAHMLLAILNCGDKAKTILSCLGFDSEQLRAELLESIGSHPPI